MMHKIKKATAHATLKCKPENAEFNDYKQRLENLSSYLKASSKALIESEQAWKEVCIRQKQFAETFANRYPDKDDVREFGRQSAAASNALVKEFTLKTDGSTAKHWEVDALVQEYLQEIQEIGSEYRPLNTASTEVAMYTKKVDDLQKAKKPDESKIARNMEKLEEAKKAYDEILDRTVDRMKEVYDKRQVALKATYVAYWSSQLRAFSLVDCSLEATRDFVNNSIDSICGIKISSMTKEEIAEFVKQNTTLEITPSPKKATGGENFEDKAVPTSPVEDAADPAAEPAKAEI